MTSSPATESADDTEVMRLWRKCGLPEYFLGNGGTNHKLVAFAEACRRPPVSSPVGESGNMTNGLPAGAGPLSGDPPSPPALSDAPQGHDAPCYYCGEPCDAYAGNPSKWPIPLCHADDPGVVKWHHTGCVSARLIENQPTSAWRDMASAPKDGSDILLWAPDYNDTPIIGRWSEGADAWDSEVATMNEGPSTGGDPEECDGPTHWMPLPLPPGEEK